MHRPLGVHEQPVGAVRVVGAPGVQPLGARTGEDGQLPHIPVAVLPRPAMPGGGEQAGGGRGVAGRGPDQDRTEHLVGGVEQHLGVRGQHEDAGPGGARLLSHPGRTGERVQQSHGVDH
ncbi:hypothetical protein SHIRM173S_07590 [Streptomyces hirsutus]